MNLTEIPRLADIFLVGLCWFVASSFSKTWKIWSQESISTLIKAVPINENANSCHTNLNESENVQSCTLHSHRDGRDLLLFTLSPRRYGLPPSETWIPKILNKNSDFFHLNWMDRISDRNWKVLSCHDQARRVQWPCSERIPHKAGRKWDDSRGCKL